MNQEKLILLYGSENAYSPEQALTLAFKITHQGSVIDAILARSDFSPEEIIIHIHNGEHSELNWKLIENLPKVTQFLKGEDENGVYKARSNEELFDIIELAKKVDEKFIWNILLDCEDVIELLSNE